MFDKLGTAPGPSHEKISVVLAPKSARILRPQSSAPKPAASDWAVLANAFFMVC